MSSRALEGLEVNGLPLFAESVPLSVPVTASLVCRAADIPSLADAEILHPSNSRDEEGSCIAGAAWAIALEAAAVFGVHGIWSLCHLLH